MNELEIKRNIAELRNNIRNNWTTTGQELSRDIRQLFVPSRPSSPAPGRRSGATSPTQAPANGTLNPSAHAHLSHLDIPKSPTTNGVSGGQGSSDFAAGYSLGLVSSVRSWMAKSQKNLNDSRGASPDSAEESDARSPAEGPVKRVKRGGDDEQEQIDAQVVDQMDIRH